MKVESLVELKKEVEELLNQIVIKTKDVSEDQPACFDENDNSIPGALDEEFLFFVRKYARTVLVNNESAAVLGEQDYYSSNC